MADDLIARLGARLISADSIREDAFGILKDLSALVTDEVAGGDQTRLVHDLVLRALDQRERFGELSGIVDALARKRGLYPYLEPSELTFQDFVAYELNRPLNIDQLVFHRLQSQVYQLLLAGQNVMLSAPTSFGKSVIVDALIASGRYANVVVVVPTIALIDETRRRLTERFRKEYKIVTHVSQSIEARNLFVLTQERVVEFEKFPTVDLFVIDEFYKLDPGRDAERANLLNQAFYRLSKFGRQFYLLGPNVRDIAFSVPPQFDCRFIVTDYATVASEVVRVTSTPVTRQDTLIELCRTLDEPTLIYCASPASARRVAGALEAANVTPPNPALEAAVAWVSQHYHPDWVFSRALRKGIGLHHGKVPRALQQYLVRSFNDDALRFLVCTSTLIEGVNTKAKNVIVYDNKISTKKVDLFTFNNIKGRSGRMLRHFIGHVYLFNDPPQEELPTLDIPAMSQSAGASNSLLIHFDDADLTPPSRERIDHFRTQETLPMDILKGNSGVDPDKQIGLAEELLGQPERYAQKLAWTGMPDYAALTAVSELIWNHLIPSTQGRGGVYSASQLAFKVNRFRVTHDIKQLILRELAQEVEPDIDKAVEETLEFIRHWATFNFPRYLMAVHRIHRSVLGKKGLPVGDYSVFAASLENYFLPAGVAALDEYGIPLQTAVKLRGQLRDPATLDEALSALRALPELIPGLDEFEQELLSDARSNL